jgi:hypothetical protein
MRRLIPLASAAILLTLASSSLRAQTASGCPDQPAPPDPTIDNVISITDTQIARDQVDEALASITDAIAAHPNDSRLEEALGRVHYRRGEIGPAIDAFNASIHLDPCNGRVHYDAWRVNAIAGRYEAAQVQLEIAHRTSPKSALIQRLWENSQLEPLDDPPHFNFYAHNLDCDGIPIRANAVVDPASLFVMCEHVRAMLAHLPNVRANMIAHGSELHLYGEDQHISDLVEYRDERGERKFYRMDDKAKTGDKIDIDQLADGLGGVYSGCPAVNVLHQHDYRPPHKEVCIHETAHNIMGEGFDANMRSQIEQRFKAATGKGLWKNAYASTNPKEFFAELSSWYFGGQGDIAHMDPAGPAPGPEALRAYDPESYALIDRLYSGQKQPKVIKFRPARVISSINPASRGPYDPAELLFVNNTGTRKRIYFVRIDGTLLDFGILQPYSRKLQPSYTTQTWLIDDPRTKTRTLYAADDSYSQITLNEPTQ